MGEMQVEGTSLIFISTGEESPEDMGVQIYRFMHGANYSVGGELVKTVQLAVSWGDSCYEVW